jgi:type IV secretory pathway VirB9-like protein
VVAAGYCRRYRRRRLLYWCQHWTRARQRLPTPAYSDGDFTNCDRHSGGAQLESLITTCSFTDQQLALFEAQKKALEQELAQKQEHLRYLEQKVAFWKAVQSGDDAKAREIGEITTGLAKQLIKEK